MKYLTAFLGALLLLGFGAFLLLSPEDSFADEIYLVSNGILVVDAEALRDNHIDIKDENGQSLGGVIAIRPGLSITDASGRLTNLGGSITDLSVFDENKDHRIDHDDSAWHAMYLAVDYNRDGEIGDGEYALIGDCGVDAITFDLANGNAWSIHKDGAKKAITIARK